MRCGQGSTHTAVEQCAVKAGGAAEVRAAPCAAAGRRMRRKMQQAAMLEAGAAPRRCRRSRGGSGWDGGAAIGALRQLGPGQWQLWGAAWGPRPHCSASPHLLVAAAGVEAGDARIQQLHVEGLAKVQQLGRHGLRPCRQPVHGRHRALGAGCRTLLAIRGLRRAWQGVRGAAGLCSRVAGPRSGRGSGLGAAASDLGCGRVDCLRPQLSTGPAAAALLRPAGRVKNALGVPAGRRNGDRWLQSICPARVSSARLPAQPPLLATSGRAGAPPACPAASSHPLGFLA